MILTNKARPATSKAGRKMRRSFLVDIVFLNAYFKYASPIFISKKQRLSIFAYGNRIDSIGISQWNFGFETSGGINFVKLIRSGVRYFRSEAGANLEIGW